MVVKNFNEFTVKPSIDKTISSLIRSSSVGISITLLCAGSGLLLVIFPFNDPTSGPKAFSAKLISSVVIFAFRIKFMRSIALRSFVVGEPKACNAFRAILALFLCRSDIYARLFSTSEFPIISLTPAK